MRKKQKIDLIRPGAPMHINPQFIVLATKTWSPIHRDDPSHYVSTIHINILYGDDRKTIGQAKVLEVKMDQIVNDDAWSLFDIFDGQSTDLGNLYNELFENDELISAVADELIDYANVVLIKSIFLMPNSNLQSR
jgi:hypothetical protein